MSSFRDNMRDYICSGHALLNVDTFEKDRAIGEIFEVAKEIDRKIYIWSIAQGWRDTNGISVCDVKATAPVEDHLQAIVDFDEGVTFILRDFGVYLRNETYPKHDIVIGWLDELRQIVASIRQTIIFVGPDFVTPKTLLHDITQIDFNLPDNEQITERINFVCSGVVTTDDKEFEIDTEIVPQVVNACRGMTSRQTDDRISLALRKHKNLNPEAIRTIIREKAGIIRNNGLLQYIEPPKGGLKNVGGYDVLKQHVLLDQPCFTQEARDFGIEFPRGLMLVGVPGCGKTLLSLAIASELGLPLIAMDIGNLMDKYVGESENNMREAIKMLESMAPCVLQLDEIEKGFGGDNGTDGGASRRIFGTFIKWLNDRKSPVYVVATANQVQSLPIEFCRKGRFDEIYGLDLPGPEERQEIFNIHISKRNRKPSDFRIKELSEISKGYTGSDIEQIVKLGLKLAFSTNSILTTSHLLEATSNIIPLSKTEKIRIEETRRWCDQHTKIANPQKKTTTSSRKVVLN